MRRWENQKEGLSLDCIQGKERLFPALTRPLEQRWSLGGLYVLFCVFPFLSYFRLFLKMPVIAGLILFFFLTKPLAELNNLICSKDWWNICTPLGIWPATATISHLLWKEVRSSTSLINLPSWCKGGCGLWSCGTKIDTNCILCS